LVEVSARIHAPYALPPGGTPPPPHWIGGWVGLRDCVDG
jgi:hypothetical protein